MGSEIWRGRGGACCLNRKTDRRAFVVARRNLAVCVPRVVSVWFGLGGLALPDGFDVADIDPATIQITSLLGVSCAPDYVQPADLGFTPQVGDRDEDGIQDLTVKFDRQLLLMNICLDDVAITVEGDLSTGDHFIGSDQIRVIERGNP